MNGKEIEYLRSLLRGRDYKELTDTEKTLWDTVWCGEMIQSAIAYDFYPGVTAKDLYERHEEYLRDYCARLGQATVMKMITETLDQVDHIHYGVMTDSEGCSYNSIVWKKETV